MESVKVSLCVAAYNVENYIEECIQSILNQTYKNIEIILVDDGSRDSSGSILDKFGIIDSRVKVIHQKNQGLSVCRNTGLSHATGDYVVFVDGDDYLADDFVEYMLQVEAQTQADIVISKYCFTTSNYRQVTEDHISVWSSKKAVSEFFYPRLPLGAWNKMYKRDFLVKNNLRFVPELTTGEGLEFITHAGSYANYVGVGERKVYYYRMNNPTSATTFANVERQGIGSINTMNYILRHLPMEDKVVKRAYNWHRWSCYNYCLRQIINAKAESQYVELYKKCIRYLRAYALCVAMLNLPLKHRCIALISCFSPRFAARIMIVKKHQQMQQ